MKENPNKTKWIDVDYFMDQKHQEEFDNIAKGWEAVENQIKLDNQQAKQSAIDKQNQQSLKEQEERKRKWNQMTAETNKMWDNLEANYENKK